MKKRAQLNRLSGIALVSHSVLDDFQLNWPDVPVMLPGFKFEVQLPEAR
jgi:hypothetical protein